MIRYVIVAIVFIGIGIYEILPLLRQGKTREIAAVITLLTLGLALSFMGVAGITIPNEILFRLSDRIIQALGIQFPY